MAAIRLDHSARVAIDEYKLYMFWAAVVLAISIAVRVGLAVFVAEAGIIEVRPDTVLRNFGQVFALIAGIVNGVYAIRYFVRQGVTRHSFLLGGILAGVGIALSLQIVAVVLATGARLFESLLPVQVASGGAAFGALAGIVIAVSFFIMGWIIGFAFCRFKVLVGMGTVLVGLLLQGVLVSIWGEGVRVTIMGIGIPPIDGLSAAMALAATAALLAAQIGALYLIVRDAPLPVQ
ncbi:MAG: hypothetical protein EA403_16250 [Spirochaetaceae bacterium]|nr:MAG: hypothetical protein EA403_16250 [Spirochaetaceae bacterium]